MWTIITPIMIFVLSIVVYNVGEKLWRQKRRWNSSISPLNMFVAILCGFYLFFMLLLGTSNYFDSVTFVEKFKAGEKTIKVMRASANKYEGVAAVNSMIELNGNLAKWKYWNTKSISGPWITDEVDKLKPIK